MVVAYREKPENYAHAARAGNCDRATARKAWQVGWASRGWPAIREIIKTERLEARAKLYDEHRAREEAALAAAEQEELDAARKLEEEAERQAAAEEKARADAIEARAEEARMVRAQRGNVIALIGIINQTARMAIDQSAELKAILAAGVDANGAKLTLSKRLAVGRELSRMMETASNAMRQVMECERILMGEPTEIVGINVNHMSIDDAAHMVGVSNRALDRAKRKGLVAIEGGLSSRYVDVDGDEVDDGELSEGTLSGDALDLISSDV